MAKRGKEAGPRVEGKARQGKGFVFLFSFFFCWPVLSSVEKKAKGQEVPGYSGWHT